MNAAMHETPNAMQRPIARIVRSRTIYGIEPLRKGKSTEDNGSGSCLRSMLTRSAPPAPLPEVREQCVLQLYTSGTTGRPKGVMISHYALSVARHRELISSDHALLAEGNISLSAMPSFHAGGLSWVLMGLVRMGTVSSPPIRRRQYAQSDSPIWRRTRLHVSSTIRAIVDDLKLRSSRRRK